MMVATRPEPLFDWFIPIDGDGVRLGTVQAERPPTFDYLREVVQTAERLGFSSLLIPTRLDRKSTRLNSSHIQKSRMPSSA